MPTSWISLCFGIIGMRSRSQLLLVGCFVFNGPLRQYFSLYRAVGWSGGAKVLGKLPVPGRPTNLDYSRARAYCACSRCGWELFGLFFSHLSLLFSFSLSLGDGPI